VRGFAGLAADGRGWRWTRQLQPDRQGRVCVGSLDCGELDLGAIAYVRERRRQHLVQRSAEREHCFARRCHHRQRAAAARQAGSGRICAATAAVITDAVTNAVTDAVTDAVTNAVTNAITNPIPDAVTDAIPDAIPDAVTDAIPNAVTNAIPDAVTNAAAPSSVHLFDRALRAERWCRRNDGNRRRDRGRRLCVDCDQQRGVDRRHIRRDRYRERVCRLQRCREHR
jgi:hypothetical protein